MQVPPALQIFTRRSDSDFRDQYFFPTSQALPKVAFRAFSFIRYRIRGEVYTTLKRDKHKDGSILQKIWPVH